MLIGLIEKIKVFTFPMFSSRGHWSSSSPWTKTECGACLVSWTKKSGVVVSSKKTLELFGDVFSLFENADFLHLFLL